MTSTELVTGQVTKTLYTYSPTTTDGVPFTGASGQVPVETIVVSQDGNGNTLKTVNKTWKSPHAMVGEQTILDNGQGTATQRCYDSNEEVIALYEYGFQSEGTKPADPTCYSSAVKAGALTNTAIGPLRRQTTTVYHPYYQWNYPNPTLPHIVNAPDGVTVADGSGTTLKQTLFGYDETGIQTSGANVQLVSPQYARANITTIRRLISGSTYAKTTYAYYDTGQVASMTDPCGYTSCTDMTGSGHTTSYSYADSYSSGTPPGQTNAFLTTVTFANTGVAHTESFTWGYSDSQIRSHADQNGQTANYLYNDPGLLGRLTEIDYPDTGSTTVAYNDAPYSASNYTPSYTVTETITSSTNRVTTTAFDGMGHTSTVLISDPPSTDYTVTTYDGFGRTRLSYNPTRCNPPTTSCGESTWGYTTTNYDALNRISSVVKQDGSTATTTYSGSCTTVTDEAGHQRRSCADGLNLLTEVDEPSSGSGLTNPMTTLYSYDPLGNLLCAEQHGSVSSSTGCSAAASSDATSQWRVRRFTYDLLSRLLSSENPETGGLAGKVTYTYDANGNLSSKTALAPNQAPAGTSTTIVGYSYDNLNRITAKSYTDNFGNPPTPSVKYGYDGIALSGCAKTPPSLSDSYPVGSRSSMCDGSGATSWNHDSMGRILREKRLIGSITTAENVDYGYNLDGSLQFLTTPPLKSLAYAYNAAGRATQVVDTTDGINFLTGATYAPAGQLISMTSGGAIQGAISYNARLQPVQLFYGTNSPTLPLTTTCPTGAAIGNLMDKTYNFAFGASDNGNVQSITNCRDTTRTQSFTYDMLNRIATAQSSGSQWGETFTIDAWGNLTNIGGISGKTYHEGLSASALNNNQLTGFGYDSAGNTTSNTAISATYVYDDENRLVWTSGQRYIYDGDGKRVEKCAAATATTACPTSGTNGTLYWRGTGGETLDETDLSGNPQEEYIFFNGVRIARRDVTSSGVTIAIHYYFADHLGSHTLVTNAAGTQIEQDLDYYPYGGVQHDYCTACVAQHYKFDGKERDTESGLDNFGARYDNSSLGRFMTPDWAAKPTTVPYATFGDPQTLNLYAFVENSPVNRIDADGHDGSASCTGHANAATCKEQQAKEAQENTKKTTHDEAAKAAKNNQGTPASLKLISATALPPGTGPNNGCPRGHFGIQLDVKYQVMDGSGNPVQDRTMIPVEQGQQPGAKPDDKTSYGPNPIGPSGKTNSTSTTAGDGTFHDVPIGICSIAPFKDKVTTQNISIKMGDGTVVPVRSNSFTMSSQKSQHGTVTNGGDINVTQ